MRTTTLQTKLIYIIAALQIGAVFAGILAAAGAVRMLRDAFTNHPAFAHHFPTWIKVYDRFGIALLVLPITWAVTTAWQTTRPSHASFPAVMLLLGIVLFVTLCYLDARILVYTYPLPLTGGLR